MKRHKRIPFVFNNFLLLSHNYSLSNVILVTSYLFTSYIIITFSARDFRSLDTPQTGIRVLSLLFRFVVADEIYCESKKKKKIFLLPAIIIYSKTNKSNELTFYPYKKIILKRIRFPIIYRMISYQWLKTIIKHKQNVSDRLNINKLWIIHRFIKLK